MANEYDNGGPTVRWGIGPDDRTYVVKTIVIPAGGQFDVPGMMDWCSILTATADTIALSYNQGRAFQALPRGIAPVFPRTKQLSLRNTGGASSTIQLAFGLGEPPRDSRLTLVADTEVLVQGVAGMVPIATQDDPLPAAAMASAELDTAAAVNLDLFTVGANVNGAWIYCASAHGAAAAFANAGILENVTTGCVYLRGPTNSTGGPILQRDRPWFVPAGEQVRWRNPAATYFRGLANYKLVP